MDAVDTVMRVADTLAARGATPDAGIQAALAVTSAAEFVATPVAELADTLVAEHAADTPAVAAATSRAVVVAEHVAVVVEPVAAVVVTAAADGAKLSPLLYSTSMFSMPIPQGVGILLCGESPFG
jgi:hypothetical protein